jgi:1-deoxy-D-xylulose-5-phosphate synthase
VAIIGDGAMSAGQAFEALNNAGDMDANLLVILNDNDMSISPPVGALNKHLARLLSGRTFNAARRAGEKVLASMPSMLEFANRVEEHVKGFISPGTLFEELGFNYIGPIDGHDLDALLPTLQNLRNLDGPQFLHVITRKGQGYKLAEADPILYHGVAKFDASNGIQQGKGVSKLTYTQVFGDWLCDMAATDSRLMGITPAMREGSGLVRFAEAYPARYFDVGIAEQHALTFAAGLACEGLKPVVAIYSTFLQRAYDQLIHDIALQNLDVTLAIDRGGLVGADGATHNGAFDLSYLTCIPNMLVMTPSDESECRRCTLSTGRWYWSRTGSDTGNHCDRQGRDATGRNECCHPCVWVDADCVSRRRARVGCHRCQYAICQAAGSRTPCKSRGTPRSVGHGRGKYRYWRRRV